MKKMIDTTTYYELLEKATTAKEVLEWRERSTRCMYELLSLGLISEKTYDELSHDMYQKEHEVLDVMIRAYVSK